MSVDGKDNGRGEISPEEREAFRRRASELGRRLDEVKGRNPIPQQDTRARSTAIGVGFRIAVELVVGVAAGGFIGWLLDRQLGTRPWLLLVFLILGIAAGMLNVFRTAQRMQKEAEPLQRAAPSVRDDDDS
jgi:ATP synthase protein I